MNADTLSIIFEFIDGYDKIHITNTSKLFRKILVVDKFRNNIYEIVYNIPFCEIENNVLHYFKKAAAKNNLIALDWLYQKFPTIINNYDIQDAIYLTAPECHSDVIKWMYNLVKNKDYIDSFNGWIFTFLCESKNTEIAKWFYYENKPKQSIRDILVRAMCGNNFETIKWLDSELPDIEDSYSYFRSAYFNSTIEIIKWTYDKYARDSLPTTYLDEHYIAADINAVKWLYTINKKFVTRKAFIYAARYCTLEKLQWLHSLEEANTISNVLLELYTTAEQGNILSGKWLVSLNKVDIIKIHSKLFVKALHCGDLEYIMWVYSLEPGKILEKINKYFKIACTKNILVAKWIYSLKKVDLSIINGLSIKKEVNEWIKTLVEKID